MIRALYRTAVTAAVLMICLLVLNACTSKQRQDWKAAHPPDEVKERAVVAAANAAGQLATGNPWGAVTTAAGFAAWLLTTGPAAVTAYRRGRKLKAAGQQLAKLTEPWTPDKGERRRRRQEVRIRRMDEPADSPAGDWQNFTARPGQRLLERDADGTTRDRFTGTAVVDLDAEFEKLDRFTPAADAPAVELDPEQLAALNRQIAADRARVAADRRGELPKINARPVEDQRAA